MKPSDCCSWVLSFVFVLLISCSSCSSFYSLPPTVANSAIEHMNNTALSSFRLLNRKKLTLCPDPNPYLQINATIHGDALSDEEFAKVTVSGVFLPSKGDWVAMVSPTDSDVSACPAKKFDYVQTGDLSYLPLLCHYPVKAQHLSNDPDYLICAKKECKKRNKNGDCEVNTCTGDLTFHVINIRTDIEFVFLGGGFDTPCVFTMSAPLKFANPNKPLYGHISSVDSTGTSMKLTWVSGSNETQQVQYGDGKTQTSHVTTFTPDDMCSLKIPSPAQDFGWHQPGYIHSAVMTGLTPSTSFSYRYGSDSVGWSDQIQFRTPPAGGSDEVRFLAFGDMGKAPRDASSEHYIQPGSISVVEAMTEEVKSGNVDSIFHIGDISYATGFLVEWDYFLQLINPMASQVSYMSAIGNHERDYPGSGSVYELTDSGGECGVPYQTYFPMPTAGKDKPWYSIEVASVHFTVISTENNWSQGSEQYQWIQKDLASVDRSKTPWLVFTGHRPMYSSHGSPLGVDKGFRHTMEPLLVASKVDLVLVGHVHNYERTCSVVNDNCLDMPKKDGNGTDVYDHSNYKAPLQAVIGMAGFTLDNFSNPGVWSMKRISEYGYLRGHATKQEMYLEFVNSNTRKVEDSFRIIR